MSFPPPESNAQTYSYSSSSSTTRKTKLGRNGETQEEFSESSQSSGGAPPHDFDSRFQRMGLDGFSSFSGFPAAHTALNYPEREEMNTGPMSPLSISTLRSSPPRSSPQPPAYTVSSPLSTLRSNASSSQQPAASPLFNAPSENRQFDNMSNTSGSSHAYKSELFIPVKQHQNTFDDFHMNRWLEHNNPAVDAQFHMQRDDWQKRLDDLKGDFFNFSPHSGETTSINSSSTIKQGPSGKPEFSVQFDVKNFKPEEINVSTKNGKLVVTANHEEKVGNSTSRRQVNRQVDIPADVQIGLMRSMLSRDGVLSVTSPIKPPNYLPAGTSTQITQQHAKALQSVPVSTVPPMIGSGIVTEAGKALDWTVSVAGYKPQEVNVTVQGRKVMVHACHDEQLGGKKSHSEMRKEFTLPESVNADHVRSFIRNGDTLHVEASLRSDLVGRIDLVPVNYKRNL